jgi:hypothetical protein|tara:strand:+ start:1004 stop:1657 length:654 start_codon:yes stop_codon:yes gene_type:complete
MTDMSFASLSPSLLARKGGAKPAMRRQSPMVDGAVAGAPLHQPEPTESALEDLGWNDLGEPGDAHPVAPEPTAPANHTDNVREHTPESAFAPLGQHARSTATSTDDDAPEQNGADETAAAAPVAAKTAAIRTRAPRLPRPQFAVANSAQPKGEPKGKRTAFTLRLDPERHLKLRLACTLANRSAQALVTEAVDAMFAATPELEQLVARVQSRPHKEG